MYANPVLVVNEVFPLNVSVDISIVVVDVPLYSALTPDVPDVPDEPEVPELPDEPEVPASVLVSNLLVVVFNTTTWSDVLPELIPYTISPLRATNSLLPAIVFFFHCPKEKFFYVYYSINSKVYINVGGLFK